jgi:hypothetical protein
MRYEEANGFVIDKGRYWPTGLAPGGVTTATRYQLHRMETAVSPGNPSHQRMRSVLKPHACKVRGGQKLVQLHRHSTAD